MRGLELDTLYLAIDPSFKGMGVATSFARIHKTRELAVEGSVKNSSLLAGHLDVLSKKLWSECIGDLVGPNTKVIAIIEMPPPRSMFSSGLFFLVGGLVMFLKKSCANIEIYGTSAMTIKSIHGSRKATKEDSVALATAWAKEVGNLVSGFGITHNQADAYLLLVYLYQTVLGIEVIKNVDYAKRLIKPRFSKLI